MGEILLFVLEEKIISPKINSTFTYIVPEPDNSKEAMRRSRTTRHETLGEMALFSFSVAVPDEIYTIADVSGSSERSDSCFLPCFTFVFGKVSIKNDASSRMSIANWVAQAM